MPSCEGHGSSSTAKPMTMPVESEMSVMYALITCIGVCACDVICADHLAEGWSWGWGWGSDSDSGCGSG